MDGCFCKEDVPWVVAMSQQIGNFPTVFRPFKYIIVWRCGQMNGSVSILWRQWMICRWWYCGPCLYNIYTHVCLRQSPKCKHIVQCRHLFVCSLCFLKVSSFVSFGGNFLPCFRLFAFGLPRVPRCDCMFHGRITPISSISSSTYPQYTSIYIPGSSQGSHFSYSWWIIGSEI